MPNLSRSLATVLAVLGATMIIPATASADVSADGCPEAPLTHPFARWLDPAWYMEVPGGDFESEPAGWRLKGATVVDGNESFYVNNRAEDEHSLLIRKGGAAVSAPFCVFVEHPTVRFFARQVRGGKSDVLAVDLHFADALGNRHVLPIGVVAGGDRNWAPSLPMLIQTALVANAFNPATVRLGFRATGNSTWQVDDVYEDPYRR